MTRAEQTEALWQWILAEWREVGWCGDLDGFDLEAKALGLGLLRQVPYDPAVHGEMDAEPGDDISVPVPAAEGP